MKQKKSLTNVRSGVGTGTTSLLMIFTVLCFATLAMLSLSTAAANQRIRQRGLEGDVAIAAAKGEAARRAAEFDAAIIDLHEQHADPVIQLGAGEAYEDAAGAIAEGLGWEYNAEARTVILRLPVDDANELLTELALEPAGSGARYTVVRQVTRLADGWTAGEEGELWQP